MSTLVKCIIKTHYISMFVKEGFVDNYIRIESSGRRHQKVEFMLPHNKWRDSIVSYASASEFIEQYDPCPFCNCADIIIVNMLVNTLGNVQYARCTGCKATAPINRWNNRS